MNVSAQRSTVIVVIDVVVGPSALHSSHLHCVQGTKVSLSSDIIVFSRIAFKEEVTLQVEERNKYGRGRFGLGGSLRRPRTAGRSHQPEELQGKGENLVLECSTMARLDSTSPICIYLTKP